MYQLRMQHKAMLANECCCMSRTDFKEKEKKKTKKLKKTKKQTENSDLSYYRCVICPLVSTETFLPACISMVYALQTSGRSWARPAYKGKTLT